MSAYVVMLRERLSDSAELEAYSALARRARSGHSVTPVVGYGAIETLEGEPFDGVLIHEFPSVEQARAWYDSPAYQAALPHRQAAADYRVFIVEGVSDTSSR
ncbi:uncharacterized protein (DUF1330 family) [Streptomyces sp. V3I8]|uniref:DUF1330 domain-containing protein n=1 Tax=Streptomyces sp. V3I8 TaxID=3042279 RepID=UPI00277E12E1|nr:DUF1330 domain-containing protein [Streptomyces sp. V3I8]MDQ1036851.1 uncharacterized protein (DUF1330 family) [Streptomyces sp. V3I8]